MCLDTEDSIQFINYGTFTLSDKLKILAEWDILGTAKTCKKFTIVKAQLRCWNRNRARLRDEARPRRVHLGGGGRPSTIPIAIQRDLVQFFDYRRGENRRVTTMVLLVELRCIYVPFQAVRTDIAKRRLYRVLRNNQIVLRRTTHVAQSRRIEPGKMRDWIVCLNEYRMIYRIPFANIANFDETNVFWSPDAATTLNRAGARTVTVGGASSSNRVTAMIGVTASGHQFPPFLIFTGKRSQHGRIIADLSRANRENRDTGTNTIGYPNDCYYEVQASGWMDQEIMLIWVERIWRPWAIAQNGFTLLILDEFSAHMTEAVKVAIANCNTLILYVPGGYTSKLQTMDVGLNKPFKDGLRDNYYGWMDGVELGAKPTRQLVSTWISNTWQAMKDTTISNTWNKIFNYGIVAEPQGEEVLEGEEVNYMEALVIAEEMDALNDDVVLG
jgi:DDE superfamily endonuclease